MSVINFENDMFAETDAIDDDNLLFGDRHKLSHESFLFLIGHFSSLLISSFSRAKV